MGAAPGKIEGEIEDEQKTVNIDNAGSTSYLDSDDDEESKRNKSATPEQTVSSPHDDISILKARFMVLNNGKESQNLHCEVFEREPYCENHFCQRLISHLLQSTAGSNGPQPDNKTVSFEKFHDEATRWQNLDEIEKIGFMFFLLKFDRNISLVFLWKLLHQSLPPCYSENECKLLAKAVIETMSIDNQSGTGLSLAQYKKWITKNIPKKMLQESLEFKISDLGSKS